METNNHKKGNNSLITAFAIAMLVIMLCFCSSCGSRKVEKSKTETKETEIVQTSKVDSSKTVTLTDSNTKVVDSSSSDEIEILPIDSTKEIVVAGKTYKNVIIRHKKHKAAKVLDESKNVSETKQNSVIESGKTQKTKTVSAEVKNIERKGFNFLNLLWLLLLIPIYLLWRNRSRLV